MMKRIISFLILTGFLFSETRNWDAHSAYLLPQKRWEMGLFQPFRYGYSENLEYSVYPLWFFVLPNFSIKKPQNDLAGFTTATQYKLVYPTPFLNMIAKSGTMGIIPPEFQMPPMLWLSSTWLMSKNMGGLDLTLNGGIDVGIAFGELDTRSTVDLPLVYHRLGVYYNKWGIHSGADVQKNMTEKIGILADVDLRLLPGLKGNYSLEHKLLISWHKSENFRIMTGYKFVMGEYPYGSDMRLLPYIPMAEAWVPIIELQWGKSRK